MVGIGENNLQLAGMSKQKQNHKNINIFILQSIALVKKEQIYYLSEFHV